MNILLFIALILAWPTSGLSIVLYIILLIAKGLLNAKARMHHADKIRSNRAVCSGSTRLPSWMVSRDKIEEFIYGIQNMAEYRGVPKLFSATTFSNNEINLYLMHYAGAMEEQGASFAEQQMAVTEKIIDIYNKAT